MSRVYWDTVRIARTMSCVVALHAAGWGVEGRGRVNLREKGGVKGKEKGRKNACRRRALLDIEGKRRDQPGRGMAGGYALDHAVSSHRRQA